MRSRPGGEGETATGDVNVAQGYIAVDFPDTNTNIERRAMLVDQYPVKGRQGGQHPKRNAK